MKQSFEVIVVGGGVVGLTAALAMASRGFEVALLDGGALTVDHSGLDPRVYAINTASQKLLDRLGIWQQLDASRLSPYERMHVWDAKSKAHIDFDARMVVSSALGHIIEESILKQAALNQIETKANITLFPKTPVSGIEKTSQGIIINTDHSRWAASLFLIADGANSLCRQLLDVPLTTWPYHQHALVSLVHTEMPHERTAYQIFHSDGPLAFLPMAEKHLCSIVWSTSPSKATRLMHAKDNAFNQSVTQAFEHQLGQVTLEGSRHCFPLIMRHAQVYTGQNWLLLGDAAHTIHPLAGLGLNVGLADIAAWLGCFDEKSHATRRKVLGAYQRQRKASLWQTIALMEGLKALFGHSLSPIVALRSAGLQLCNHSSALKKLFIAQASG